MSEELLNPYERKNEKRIPEEIKIDAWRMYELMMSADPAYATQFCLKTITHLQLIMKMGDVHDYDLVLNQAMKRASIALADYVDLSDSAHEGKALQGVAEVNLLIGYLMYDKRFTKRDDEAFLSKSEP